MSHKAIPSITIIFLILGFGMWGCNATKTASERENKTAILSTSIRKLALDPLGQLYVVTQTNEVIQYQADGTMGFRYNNNTLGKLELIDPTNPLTILLYYPDFQTIVLLDRTLNEKTRIQLSTLNLLDIQLVALSNDNYIWLYDMVDTQLKKLDQEGNIGFQSDRIDLLLQQKLNPKQLLANYNRLILNDPEKGIFIFDIYGRYETTLPVLTAEHLQMTDDHTLVYLRAGGIFAYDLRSLQEKPLDLGVSCSSDCQLCIGKEKVYWLEQGALREADF